MKSAPAEIDVRQRFPLSMCSPKTTWPCRLWHCDISKRR